METKHTPGPWEAKQIYGWGDAQCVAAAASSHPLAMTVRSKAYYTDYVTTSDGGKILSDERAAAAGNYVATPEIKAAVLEREMADARLIAAAPELLAVVEMIRDADNDAESDGLQRIPATARAAIDAAIAKATGSVA